MEKVSKKIGFEVIKKSITPIIIIIIFIGAYIHYRIQIKSTISPELAITLKKYISTVFIMCIAFIAQRVTGALLGWYGANIALKTPTNLDDKLVGLLRRTLKIIIWTVAILVILPFYGVNISALIAALGVSSLAIALAAQDTIANVIAGFLILVDSPFRIGDKIKLPSGEDVEVLDISIRRSRFLSKDGAIVIVPNLDLSKSKIINYTYGEEKRRI